MNYLIAGIDSWIRALELLDLLASVVVVTAASEEVVIVVFSKSCLIVVGCELGCVVSKGGTLASKEVVAGWREGLNVITLGLSSYLTVSDGGLGTECDITSLPPESKSSRDGNLSAIVNYCGGVREIYCFMCWC